MNRILLAFLVAVAACSPGDASDTTTTSTSAPSAPKTSARPTTTTTPPPASTTNAAPTTTTTAGSTTTSLVEGNWADEPLITTDFGALGWWDGANWLDAEIEGALPIVGGEDYQTIVGSSLGMTTAGPQTIACEPLGLIGVMLADPDLLGEWPGPFGVAISAPWALQPYLYEEITDDGTYADFAAELLAERGFDVDEPEIKQLVRTDLEGDGVNEVLVVAEEVNPSYLMEPGDYSLLFLRKVIEGEVQTAILGETIVEDEAGQFFGAHSVGTVADLNGDGKMEIVSGTAFFEGFNVTAWEYVNDDLGPFPQLQTGCGA